MERITVENQVTNANFYGHKDHEELSDYVLQAMKDLGLAGARVGLEKRSLFRPLGMQSAYKTIRRVSHGQMRPDFSMISVQSSPRSKWSTRAKPLVQSIWAP